MIETIVNYMKTTDATSSIQRVQTAHRLRLAKAFGIKEGMNILEIGCGQGDTTAVLAHLVGDSGHVTAIDIAPETYGAPITLGNAQAHIQTSPIGSRIDVHFETDIQEVTGDFDAVVLCHCSWYMHNEVELLHVLKAAAKLAPILLIAEWDIEHAKKDQQAHKAAAELQILYNASHKTDGNIQMLFTSSDLIRIAKEAGFSQTIYKQVEAGELQDGCWEVEFALTLSDFSKKEEKQVTTLKNTIAQFKDIVSLHSAVLICTKD